MSQLPLNAEDHDRLDSARAWLKRHFTHDPDHKYRSIEGKLRLLEAILDGGWIEPDETWKLQALGVGFGDALAQELGVKWIAVDDSDGRDPALLWPGTTLLCFPLTMISKRVEAGEKVDPVDLFAKTAATMRAAAKSGRFG